MAINNSPSAHVRLESAKASLVQIQSALRALIDLHENTRILLFSDQIADQVDDTVAMNALERCRIAIFETELVRLCALWDAPEAKNTLPSEISLPAVAYLVDDIDILELVRNEYIPHEKRLGVRLWRGPESIKKHVDRISRVANSELLIRVRNYRTKYLAHNLTETKLERKRAEQLPIPRYRNVAELLGATIAIAHDLTIDVTGTNFIWSIQRENSKRCAEALWLGCKITPLE